MRRPAVLPLAGALAVSLVLGVAGPASSAVAELDAARSRANEAATELAEAETEIAEIEAEVAALEQRAAAGETRVTELGASVARLAVEEFMTGSEEGMSVIDLDLSAGARADALAGFVSGGTAEALERYRAAVDDLQASGTDLERRRAAMEAAVGDLDRRRSEAMAEVARLERVAAERRAEEAARRRPTASRSTSGNGAGQPGSDGASALAAAPAVVASGGAGWLCPVQGPVAFTNDWGMPRSGGRRHQGTDLLSPRGTPVVASVGGTVKAHSSSLGGISYYLNGDDGNTYYGAHLSRLSGATGRVERGTVVGFVGDSGNARGTNHLHFEIHPGGGGAVNPYPTVSKHC